MFVEKNIPTAPTKKLKIANRRRSERRKVVEESVLMMIRNGTSFWSVERTKMDGQLR